MKRVYGVDVVVCCRTVRYQPVTSECTVPPTKVSLLFLTITTITTTEDNSKDAVYTSVRSK